MVRFKIFMTIYLLAIVAVSIFALVILPQLNENRDMMTDLMANHYSVRWMGFAPTDFNDSYPEYYICINNLKDDPLTMQIALQIKNQEDSGYYFLIDQYMTPPAGWMILPHQVGYIEVDETKTFVYAGASRTLPSSISSGRLTETITLVVRAYYDEYVTLYSEDHFSVTFNFIDRLSSAWSIYYNDDFDDATVQGWASTNEGGKEHSGCSYGSSITVSDEYYRSFQYSLKLDAWATGYHVDYVGGYAAWVHAAYRKTFDVAPASEVYLIFSVRTEDWTASNEHGVSINGTTYFKSDVTPSTNIWYQFTVPLQLSYSGTTHTYIVDIWASYAYHWDTGTTHKYACLDDVYVIAK